jgi:predicted SAM-dependent methyltransferase
MPPRTESWREFLTLADRRLRREARRARHAALGSPEAKSYLASEPVAKLQVGAGDNVLPGWLNTDRDPTPGSAYLDATHRFPLPDASFDYVMSEHTIEHLTLAQADSMLGECHRVLKPGGKVRIATPNLRWVAGLLDAQDGDERSRYIRWSTDTFLPGVGEYRPAYVINQLVRGWGHRFIYDEATLSARLEKAGFRNVQRFGVGESDDPELTGVDLHGADDASREMIRHETLVLQAVRPS